MVHEQKWICVLEEENRFLWGEMEQSSYGEKMIRWKTLLFEELSNLNRNSGDDKIFKYDCFPDLKNLSISCSMA